MNQVGKVKVVMFRAQYLASLRLFKVVDTFHFYGILIRKSYNSGT